MQLIIEKGIPLPSQRRYGGGRMRRHIGWQMEVGDSVLLPGDAKERMAKRFYQIGKKEGRKYAFRKEEAGTRVWRIA